MKEYACFNQISEKQHTDDKKTFNLNCINLNENKNNSIEYSDYGIELVHKQDDPENVNRILISHYDLNIELLPSKGLSVGESFYQEKSIFWKPPLEKLPDPDKINLKAPMYINDVREIGYRWIETFTGGIEMCGLNNWGMPFTDKESGKLFTLHGEVSNIPVKNIYTEISSSGMEVIGLFFVRSFEGEENIPWYERGKILYEVVKRIILIKNKPKIIISDQIINKCNEIMEPDWGYHVKFYVEENAKYLVPSLWIERRFGGDMEPGDEIWKKAKKENQREETVIIHKRLKITPKAIPRDEDGIKTLIQYSDGRGILFTAPPVPYFQSCFSSGGKNGKSFMLEKGVPLLKKNWDGVGPEFGSSDIDHKNNIDKEIEYKKSLKPGESKIINMALEVLDNSKTLKLAEEIMAYQSSHLINECEKLKEDSAQLANGLLEIIQGKLDLTLKHHKIGQYHSCHSNVAYLYNSIRTIRENLIQSFSFFNTITSPNSKRMCYVGADSYLEGTMCGKEMIRLLNAKGKSKGKIAIVTAWFKEIGINQRMNGFKSILDEYAPEVKIVEYAESHFDINRAKELTINILNNYPDLDAIYATEAISPIGVAMGTEEAGYAGKIIIVGHDCPSDTMNYVIKGTITSTLSQDPFAQGYNPLVFLYNKIVADQNPPKTSMLTDIVMVNQDNWKEYWDEEKGLVETENTMKRLAKLVDKIPEKPIKLAMVTRDALEFDNQIKMGFLKVKELLETRNTTAEWVVPYKGADSSAEYFGPEMVKLAKQGYNGLATMAHDSMFVPFINECVNMGVPVVTFNTDPYSLRESVSNIYEQQKHLIQLQNEMQIAKKIQTSLLPPLKKIRDFDISAEMIPAEDVGGDYYDFYLEPEKKHWYCIGDVSGHGLTSGLIMLMTQSAVITTLKYNPDIDLKKLYVTINKVLYENIRQRLLQDHYMTLSFLVSDMQGAFKYIGSHIAQIIYRSKDSKCELIKSEGLWVGLTPEVGHTVVEKHFELKKNDILLLFTDGVIEARNKSHEQFNIERLQDILIKNHKKSADEIKNVIVQLVFDFINNQDDDITLFIIKKL